MKEATGELNMTVIVVIIVAILLSFFYTVIWPIIKKTLVTTTQCKNSVCLERDRNMNEGTVRCTYTDRKTGQKTPVVCTWKG